MLMELINIINCSPVSEVANKLYVIDGSNVAFEIRTPNKKPSLSNILKLMESLKHLRIRQFKVICDKSLYYCIDDKQKYSQLINEGIIIETPAGNPSDIFILQLAYQKEGYIISNDKYREYYSIFGKNWVESRRISFRIIDDVFCFNKIIINGGEKNE
jgi:hypothetical protein